MEHREYVTGVFESDPRRGLREGSREGQCRGLRSEGPVDYVQTRTAYGRICSARAEKMTGSQTGAVETRRKFKELGPRARRMRVDRGEVHKHGAGYSFLCSLSKTDDICRKAYQEEKLK